MGLDFCCEAFRLPASGHGVEEIELGLQRPVAGGGVDGDGGGCARLGWLVGRGDAWAGDDGDDFIFGRSVSRCAVLLFRAPGEHGCYHA